jgi:hypothetical protein
VSHTPTPYTSNPNQGLQRAGVYAGDGEEIIVCEVTDEDVPTEVFKANAEFIVQACNSFDALLAACKIASDAFSALKETNNLPNGWNVSVLKPINAAIALAEAKS